MRIALLSYRSKPHCGGQGVYVRYLSRGLTELGHDVEVFSGQPYPEDLDPRVRLTEVPSMDFFREPDPFRTPRPGEFHSATDVLFSGQDALPDLVANVADYSVATLVLLAVCKMVMYSLSLSAFRGGPIFPAMLVGAVLGMAMAGLPGMSMAPAIGMGIGAMCVAMLRLPLTSTLLAVLLLGSDGVGETPQIIIAVVVAFVVSNLLPPQGPPSLPPDTPAPAPA